MFCHELLIQWIARQRQYIEARAPAFKIRFATHRHPDVQQVLMVKRRIETNTWEPDLLRACFEHIKDDEVIFDIGTWIGAYTVLLSRFVTPKGRVIGFEPDPVAFRQAIINLQLNQCDNATILPLAISNKCGNVDIYASRNLGESTSSTSSRPGLGVRSAACCATLDGIIAALGKTPTTVKIDVEGGESEVIDGATSWLQKRNVKAFVEVHHEFLLQRGMNANTVLRQLAGYGKKLHFLESHPSHPYRLMQIMDANQPIDVPCFHVLAL